MPPEAHANQADRQLGTIGGSRSDLELHLRAILGEIDEVLKDYARPDPELERLSKEVENQIMVLDATVEQLTRRAETLER